MDIAVGYYAALTVSFLLCIGAFARNQKYRNAIDHSLATVEGAVPFKIPERLKFYDAGYLNSFKEAAAGLSTPYGNSALELYVRPTLLWLDVCFAISLSALAALIWWGILQWFPQFSFIAGAAKFCLTMAVLYGVADVAEDIWLAKLLSRQGPVSGGAGWLACKLTQLKLITIVLSLIGGAVFVLLSRIFR